MRILITCFLLAFMISSMAMAEECKDIDFTLDADNIRALALDTGAGYLDITGASDSDDIEVNARACADSRRQLDEMDVLYQRRGNTWEVETEVGNARDGFSVFSLFDFNSQARIDMDVRVPAGLLLEVDDGSGAINVRNVTGELRIEDGSGSIGISQFTGPVDIDDGSGGIDVHDVNGRVHVNDGSGSITIARTMDVTVRDGSGSIAIRDIEGNVHIPDDGSGSIRIERVSGNVLVDDDGSGGIHVEGVRGDFTARSTGSGDVLYRDVDGRVDVRD
ncbi:MAG: hypothetical protein ACQETO_01880 [Pseudomonadota bacterium]